MFVSLTTIKTIKVFGHELGMSNDFKLEDIFIYFYSICLIQGKLRFTQESHQSAHLWALGY